MAKYKKRSDRINRKQPSGNSQGIGSRNPGSKSGKISKKPSKMNPFEIRFVKEKHTVVNRKLKTDAGKPGISRAKAIQIRKDTLLQEYKRKNKNNVFIDRRIGEKDAKLSAEDKMIARFAAERGQTKKNIFNLGEEETLTHFGKSLADVEAFEDPRSDDEDDEKTMGKDIVDDAHFGGFLTRSDVEFASGKSNNRQEWIDQMIADSKKRKAQKLKDQEESTKMTEDLDQKWKELATSFKGSDGFYTKKIKHPESDEEDGKADDYTTLMKELMFQPKKAKAQDRIKTQEEVVKEAKEKLEKLEKDRIKRMNGDIEKSSDEETDEEENHDKPKEKYKETDAEDKEESSEEDEEESEDDYSDLEDEEEEDIKPKKRKKSKKDVAVEMSKAREEIPYTFEVPESYDQLVEHFNGRTPEQKGIIVERIIKCNHPQFGADNTAQLENLFRYLLQYLHDCGTVDEEEEVKNSLETVGHISPFLYDLCKFSPAPNAKAVLSVVQEKYGDHCKNPRIFPTLESLIFMKLVILLFPASDYRHPVVTPTLQWMSHVLAVAKPTSKFAITSGLFISGVFVEAISLSRRFSPELLNFLTGLVFVSCPEDETLKPQQLLMRHVPPFKAVGLESRLFYDLFTFDTCPESLKYSDCLDEDSEDNMDDIFVATSLQSSLRLLSQLVDLWKKLPAAKRAFHRLKSYLLPKLPREKLHKNINETIDELEKKLEDLSESKEVTPVVRKEPVTMLKLHEPLIEEDFDPFQKKREGSREKLELEKLQHKVKRERKAAKKDLRRDTAFLAKRKAKEARDKDAERVKKTKLILGGLGSQEGEYRKFLNSKKKKR